MEEIIYVISGHGEQWVDAKSRILGPGEIAHIPRDVVHGTYNTSDEELVFLAILSPAKFEGPWLVDVSEEEPWRSIRNPA
jgi:quercetin dioxygenase-like cupin family protein